MTPKRLVAAVAILVAMLSTVAFAQENTTRMVEGKVMDSADAPVADAVVQLKDTKSLQVRSFRTQADGAYHFAGLSTNVDYELKADREGTSSGTKRVSVFNSSKVVTVDLKLTKK